MKNAYSRRDILRTLGAAGLASCFGGSSYALEPPLPKLTRATPAIYPFKIGDLEAIVISDGTLTAKPPFPKLAPNATAAEVDALLAANLQPTSHVTMYLNVLLLRVGNELVLFDTGVGPMRGPSCGWLMNNLKAAGVAPGDVSAVLLSHAHGDHFGGLHDAEMKLAFPNAKLFANPAEIDFWLAPSPDLSKCYESPEFKKTQVAWVHRSLDPIRAMFEPMKPGDTLFGCIEVLDVPGHTPGHLNYRITSGSEVFTHIVDVAHSYVLMIQRPDWCTSYDVLPDLGIDSRKKALATLAETKGSMMGYHLPFPGIGKIGAEADGFRWFPESWHWG